MNKISKVLTAAAVLLISLSLITFPQQASDGVVNGINICISTIIPTLFPFMVLSQFIVRSGICDQIGKICSLIFKPIFGLPQECAAVVIMGLTGGYPIGAKMSAQLYKEGKISLSHLKRLLCFTVNAGPSFIIATVGTMLLGSYHAGLLIFFATILSSLTIGVLSQFFFKNDQMPIKAVINHQSNLSDSFANSVSDAAKALLSMCSYILLICSLTSVMEATGLMKVIVDTVSPPLVNIGMRQTAAEAIIYCLLEVGSGCIKACDSAMLMCWAIGWGGLSVHLQIYSILSDIKISRIIFTISRLVAAALNCIYFKILLKLFPADIEVFNNTIKGFSINIGQILVSFMYVLIMLAAVNKKMKMIRKN